MILFDLRCKHGHAFEGWFRDGATYEEQARAGAIVCAVCGDTEVSKALMAPAVSTRPRTMPTPRDGSADGEADGAARRRPESSADGGPPSPGGGPPAPRPRVEPAKVARMMRMLREVQTHIQNNFDHVGRRFPEEARKIHLGESDKRNIYGEATADEAKELRDEGIEVQQIPWLPRHDA